MKLLEAIKQKGGRIEIPDCSRHDLPQFFMDMGLTKGVEIGVENGYFSEELCKAGLEVYSIDPWIYCPDWEYQRAQDKMNSIYENAKKRLSKFPKCTIIKKFSMDALADFPDESLDFVYIDGNHEFRYVAEDIYEWEKKVRKGGIVSGHDYFTPRRRRICAVAPILHAFVQWFDIETWYVLGSRRQKGNEVRDPTRSWFFIK